VLLLPDVAMAVAVAPAAVVVAVVVVVVEVVVPVAPFVERRKIAANLLDLTNPSPVEMS
jgi:hypothetical protein